MHFHESLITKKFKDNLSNVLKSVSFKTAFFYGLPIKWVEVSFKMNEAKIMASTQ